MKTNATDFIVNVNNLIINDDLEIFILKEDFSNIISSIIEKLNLPESKISIIKDKFNFESHYIVCPHTQNIYYHFEFLIKIIKIIKQ
jgi:hypothetical protein